MVLNTVKKIKRQFPDIHFVEVDITQRPDMAVKYRIMATPVIAINGKVEFIGVPKEDALRQLIVRLQNS